MRLESLELKFTYFLSFLLASNTALIVIGIPESVIWPSIIFLLTIDFIYTLIIKNKTINKKGFQLFVPLIGILIIDKFNDFFFSFAIRDFIAIVAGFLLVFKTLSISKSEHSSKVFWKAFFHACHFSFFILLLYYLVSGVDVRDADQYLNIYFLLILFYHYSLSRKKLLMASIVVILLFFYFLISDARFIIICTLVVLILSVFNAKSYIFKRRVLSFFWFFSPIILIGAAIGFEFFNAGGTSEISNEFTGRGFLWYNFISLPITQNSLFLGLPSSENFVKSLSNSLIFNGSSYAEDYMGLVIQGGNTHNGLVYIFYNSGVIGVVLFYIFLLLTFKEKTVVEYNWILILTCGIIFLLFGRSMYGIYFLGNVTLFASTIPFIFGNGHIAPSH